MGIEKLKRLGMVKKFKAKEFISYEGEIGTEMYLILSGQVGVYLDSFGGVPERVAILETGEFFGEMSILEDAPRNASGIAETEVIVLVIAKENFRRFLQEMPDLGFTMMQNLSKRIRLLEGALLECNGGNKEVLLAVNFGEPAAKIQRSDLMPTTNGLAGVFPENHRVYHVFAPETHKNFYFEKKINCPICASEFTTKIPRMTKLRLDRIENDLREVFTDFDPLWYTIRTCPYCFFAQVYTEFDKTQRLSEKGLLPYQERALTLQGKITLPTAEPLGIDRVLADYYLAIYFARVEKKNSLLLGKLHMSLAWLYQDMGDEELYDRSWRQAFDYYHQAYYGGNNVKLKPEHEQQLCLILGELYLRKGDRKEALKHFYKAIRRLDGSNYYNNRARDRYMEIKEDHDAEVSE